MSVWIRNNLHYRINALYGLTDAKGILKNLFCLSFATKSAFYDVLIMVKKHNDPFKAPQSPHILHSSTQRYI